MSETTISRVGRHERLLTSINLALAALAIQMLVAGFFKIAQAPDDDPEKMLVLGWHMALGTLVVLLLIARGVFRKKSTQAPDQGKMQPIANRLQNFANRLFFTLMIPVAATGFATVFVSGLPMIVFRSWGEPLSTSFKGSISYMAHDVFAVLLVGTIGLYIVAALWRLLTSRRGA